MDEVKQYHFVFVNRDFARFQKWNRYKATRSNGQPGLYLLRGEYKEPLYVGQTRDLGRRLAQHLECPAMAEVVTHVSILAGDDLPGPEYRAAFKEDLVRRYQPRWNVCLVGLHSATAD